MIPGLDIIFGGITGLIGNAFTTYFKYKNAQMEYTHEEKMVDLQTQSMIKEAQAQIEITKSKIEGDIELADTAAYQETLKAEEKQMFGDKWVDTMLSSTGWSKYFLQPIGCLLAVIFALIDGIRALMRPTLTAYLVGLSTYITYLAWKILEANHIESLSATQASDIFLQVISTVIYLTVSAVTWWFGDRSMNKYLQGKELGLKKKTNGDSASWSKGGL
jgi:hypothetical protein